MNSDVNGGSLSGGKQPKNRRSSERVKTRRDVLFSDYEATGPIRVGLAVNMSAGGFRITTRYPESPGCEIQIELQPKPGDLADVALFRGRVVHVETLGDGEFAMGVRNLQRGGVGSAALSRGLLSLAATSGSAKDARQRRLTSAGQRRHELSSPRRVVFSKVEQRNRKRRKWLPWGSLLVLFSILCTLLLEAAYDERPNVRGLFGGKFVYAIHDEEAAIEPKFSEEWLSEAGRGGTTEEFETTDPYPWDFGGGIDTLLNRAQAALYRGDVEEAQALFETLERHPEADAIHRYVSLLGHAEASAARGERSLARTVLRRAMKLDGDVPVAWRQAARDLEAKLQAGGAAPFAATSMDSLILMTRASKENSNRDLIRIEVDVSKYLLSVIRGDEILRSFPVGLGRNGATPSGTFRIANKIAEPDWYHEGEVVPAGDPGNPLGASWMGLGDGDSALSYGLHPTADAASIGKPMSEGCVRMRPRDAETLFRLVPLGTLVHIRR